MVLKHVTCMSIEQKALYADILFKWVKQNVLWMTGSLMKPLNPIQLIFMNCTESHHQDLNHSLRTTALMDSLFLDIDFGLDVTFVNVQLVLVLSGCM